MDYFALLRIWKTEGCLKVTIFFLKKANELKTDTIRRADHNLQSVKIGENLQRNEDRGIDALLMQFLMQFKIHYAISKIMPKNDPIKPPRY